MKRYINDPRSDDEAGGVAMDMRRHPADLEARCDAVSGLVHVCVLSDRWDA
jgi:hypothetical protein